MLRRFTRTAVSLAAVSFAAASGASLAADLPSRVSAPPPSPFFAAPVASWTGFYLGVDLGGQWSKNSWTSTNFGVPPGILTAATANRSLNQSSVYIGEHIGYDVQVNNNVVVGIQGLIGANLGDRVVTSGSLPGRPVVASTDRLNSRLLWDGAIRGKLGYLVTPDWLLYGTAGAAFQKVDYSSACTLGSGWCIATRADSQRKVASGWTIGAGVEGRLSGNWYGNLDYRYSDFGRQNRQFFTTTPIDQWGGGAKLATHTVTAGISYKFNFGSSSAVAAKY